MATSGPPHHSGDDEGNQQTWSDHDQGGGAQEDERGRCGSADQGTDQPHGSQHHADPDENLTGGPAALQQHDQATGGDQDGGGTDSETESCAHGRRVDAASRGWCWGGLGPMSGWAPTHLRYTVEVPIDIDIAHVARLARLELDPGDLEVYRQQLGDILEHAARVQAVATGDVEPTGHPSGITNAFREDEVRPSLDRDEVLAQAPDHRHGFFVVPPALELE